MAAKKPETPEPIDVLSAVVDQVKARESEADKRRSDRTAELKAQLEDLRERLENNAREFAAVSPRAQRIVAAYREVGLTNERIPRSQTRIERRIFEELKQLTGALSKTPNMILSAREWFEELDASQWRTHELARRKFQTLVGPIGDTARVIAERCTRLEKLALEYARAAGAPSREAREVPPDELVEHLQAHGVTEREPAERVLSDVLKS
jgi:hypothetical protein